MAAIALGDNLVYLSLNQDCSDTGKGANHQLLLTEHFPQRFLVLVLVIESPHQLNI
jgi:hypothetical protein